MIPVWIPIALITNKVILLAGLNSTEEQAKLTNYWKTHYGWIPTEMLQKKLQNVKPFISNNDLQYN